MPVGGIDIAISGIQAATRRFGVSADNVANLRSRGVPNGPEGADAEGFRPRESQDTAQPTGGVSSTARLVSPASVQIYAPDSPEADADGVVDLPNVALEREAVTQSLASRQLEASVATLRTADELTRRILDIKS